MWGQVNFDIGRLRAFRIIPTRVGTRRHSVQTAHTIWDHPHACGDKKHLHPTQKPVAGSSPRVWGQASFGYRLPSLMGIIPTRVGTSFLRRQRAQAVWDHPHACGDKRMCVYSITLKIGSSPRVWGQDSTNYGKQKDLGIIPTRVGTRSYHHRRVVKS